MLVPFLLSWDRGDFKGESFFTGLETKTKCMLSCFKAFYWQLQ